MNIDDISLFPREMCSWNMLATNSDRIFFGRSLVLPSRVTYYVVTNLLVLCIICCSLAMEELLLEAKDGAERAKLMGPTGWSVLS